MSVDPISTRRYSSVNSAAGVMVDKEFVFERKDRVTEPYLAEKEIAQRLRRRFVVEVVAVSAVIAAIILGLLFLPL